MKTILMVDDDPVVRAEIRSGLTSAAVPLRVFEAENGRQALEILDREAIDLLITDLDMPVLDGFELLVLVQQQNPALPVIVMSSFGVSAIDDELEKIGVISYIEKPFDKATVASQIQQALTRLAQGHMSGVSILGFLQLLHFEKKSCSLAIKSGERLGRIFLSDGELIDAACDKLKGEKAVLEILSWDDCEMVLSMPRHFRRAIHRPLQGLLLEAARLLDEHRRSGFEHIIESAALSSDPEIFDEVVLREVPAAITSFAATVQDSAGQGLAPWDGLQELLTGPMGIPGVLGVAVVALDPPQVLVARHASERTDFLAAALAHADLVGQGLGRRRGEDALRELLLTHQGIQEFWVPLDAAREHALFLLLNPKLSSLREVRREAALIQPTLGARLTALDPSPTPP